MGYDASELNHTKQFHLENVTEGNPTKEGIKYKSMFIIMRTLVNGGFQDVEEHHYFYKPEAPMLHVKILLNASLSESLSIKQSI